MDWGNVGKQLIGMGVPLMGTMLLGPAGGAAASGAVSVATSLISSALGVEPEPDKVLEAIKNDPNAIVKIKEIEADQKVELRRLTVQSEANRLAAETSQISTVNMTMRMEAETKQWWRPSTIWRPSWGVFGSLAFFETVNVILYIALKAFGASDYKAIAALPQLVGAIVTLFAIPTAILGISAHHRGKMQRIQAGEVSGGILGGVVGNFFKRRKGKNG